MVVVMTTLMDFRADIVIFYFSLWYCSGSSKLES